MRRETIHFYAESVEPIRLEGILGLPDAAEGCPAAILCHPHPIGGGSMHVPLLEVMERALVGTGRACIRFNFRGVGGSAGRPSGGLEESEDVEGAYRWLLERGTLDMDDIGVAGWSFGAWVGLKWAAESGAARRIALVSPVTVGFDFYDFLESGEIDLPEDSLIICGDRDQFTNEVRLRELAERIGAELRLLEGADHFLFGRESEIAELVADRWDKGRI